MAEAAAEEANEPKHCPFAPSVLCVEYVMAVIAEMLAFSHDPKCLRRIFTAKDIKDLLTATRDVLGPLPNITEFRMPVDDDSSTVVVGDIHGQFHDLVSIIRGHGMPSAGQRYVFNGDFVDRGSWGVEICITVFLMKLVFPEYVYLCRGNHETSYCTKAYGFYQECVTKYSASVYENFSKTFVLLPLACVILPCLPFDDANDDDDDECVATIFSKQQPPSVMGPGVGVLVMHGGLFKSRETGDVGTLQHLLDIDRRDPDPQNTIVEDVLWSDPWTDYGQGHNGMRGCGICFGANVTASFLQDHGLSLLVRSHEGPDARRKRPWIEETMMEGYAIDHRHAANGTPMLVTVFSAPDYPQGPNHSNNEASIMRLRFHTGDDDDDDDDDKSNNNNGDGNGNGDVDDNGNNDDDAAAAAAADAVVTSVCESCLRVVHHDTKVEVFTQGTKTARIRVSLRFHVFAAVATPDIPPYLDDDDDDDGAVTDKD